MLTKKVEEIQHMEKQIENKTVKLDELGAGSIFEYGGMKWALLDQGFKAALCIAAGIIDNRAFDTNDRNDFAVSTIRAYLNGEFLDGLSANGADRDAFNTIPLILTSDDGLDDYGIDSTTIGLITCDLYRQFRQHIPVVDDWWWTATPWSTKGGRSNRDVRVVYYSGVMDEDCAYCCNGGVRPICALSSDILVSANDEDIKPREVDARLLNGTAMLRGMAAGFKNPCPETTEAIAKAVKAIKDTIEAEACDEDDCGAMTFKDCRDMMMDCLFSAQGEYLANGSKHEELKDMVAAYRSIAEIEIWLMETEAKKNDGNT